MTEDYSRGPEQGASFLEYSDFVLVEDKGFLCCIPAALFPQAYLEQRAADLVTKARRLSLDDIVGLVQGESSLEKEMRAFVWEFLEAEFGGAREDWGTDELWEHLLDLGAVEEDDWSDDWKPTLPLISQIQVEVPESFYESQGLRSVQWMEFLPDAVAELAVADGGMFGEYAGFDPDDETKVRAALEGAGCVVIPAINPLQR